MSRIDTKNDKKPKIFKFSKILCVFSIFSTEVVDWSVKKGQQGKLCCPVGFLEEFIAVFSVKVFQIDTEIDKKPKFSNFRIFRHIFYRHRGFECFKRSTNKKLVDQ